LHRTCDAAPSAEGAIPSLIQVPRQPRVRVPGGVYHVVCRAVARRPLFADDRDRVRYVSQLAEVCTAGD